jgi:hypothetical protein
MECSSARQLRTRAAVTIRLARLGGLTFVVTGRRAPSPARRAASSASTLAASSSLRSWGVTCHAIEWGPVEGEGRVQVRVGVRVRARVTVAAISV